MKTKKLDDMADCEVLAMALDDMEFLGLIRWKPDTGQKPAIVRNALGQEQHVVSEVAAA